MSPLSKHCDGAGETAVPSWRAFEDQSTNWPVIHTNASLVPSFFLGNSTWSIYNNTTGSIGLISFKEIDKHYPDVTLPRDSYTRILHGNIYKGTMGSGLIELNTDLELCPQNADKCTFIMIQ